MEKLKKNEGITLIALVITIIILLILAGVSIAQLSGNGLFEKAKIAKEESKNAQDDENDKIAKYKNEIDSYIDGNREGDLSDAVKQYIDEKVDGTVLWTNPNPAQAFAAQTVPINNIMSYKKIKIVCETYKAENFFMNSEIEVINLNQEGILTRAWTSYTNANTYYIDHREYFVVENGIQFKDARTSQSANNDNNRMIPHKIIGYK